MMYGTFCLTLLEAVFDLAFERHPAVADRHIQFVSRNSDIPLEGVEHSSSNVGVGAFGSAWQVHLDVVDDRLDAMNAMSGRFGSQLFQIRIDPASQRDDSIL